MQKLEGLDEEIIQGEAKEETSVVSYEEVKRKRRPFHYWTVGGTDHRMKLTTGMTTKLENKYGTNVMNLIMADSTPPLSVMLTVAQAALAPWEHNTTIDKVYRLYDQWIDEGGSQTEFLQKIIFPTLAVSGFFSAAQTESLLRAVEEADILN